MNGDFHVKVAEERVPELLAELQKRTAAASPPIPLESTPLHQLLGPALLSQIMLMALHRQGDVAIYCCKHVGTRRALNIGDDLRAWNYDAASETFHHLPLGKALAYALEGTEEAGLLPGDDVTAWRARRQGEAVARGERVIVCEIGQGIVSDTGTATV